MRRSLLAAGALVLVLCPRALANPSAPDGPGKTFHANGTTIWYEVRGHAHGTPFVLVNGGPGFDHRYMLCSDVWDRLARERPVVFYDQRGNGRSAPIVRGQSCTLNDQVADLEALRRTLGVERMDLLGHSWGGYLVMAYTAVHPEHVAHLIICDSAAPRFSDTEFIFKYVYPERVASEARFDSRDALGDSTALAASLDEYMHMLFVSAAKRDTFLAMMARGHVGMNRAVNEAIVASLASVDLNPLLATFTTPTLVLTGRFDMNVAPSTAWRIHQAIPGSRFVAFEHSGHIPYFEEPEKFLDTVRGFLAGK